MMENITQRFASVLEGRNQSKFFQGPLMLEQIERTLKRVVGRQIDQRVLTELARYKLEFLLYESTEKAITATIASIVLSSANVKVLSFVKSRDMTEVAPNGTMLSDILVIGIEADPTNGDDWCDMLVKVEIVYAADKTTATAMNFTFAGVGKHVKIYHDEAAVYDSITNVNVSSYSASVDLTA
jgi:hypothetical protein